MIFLADADSEITLSLSHVYWATGVVIGALVSVVGILWKENKTKQRLIEKLLRAVPRQDGGSDDGE
jgi:hypothetical protein